jgi:hypothetical protein
MNRRFLVLRLWSVVRRSWFRYFFDSFRYNPFFARVDCHITERNDTDESFFPI